ncbi:MAG: DUF309 domain-containing protein [Gemmatimonadota bacterium]
MNAPAILHDFVAQFNAGRYWESHEVLESEWRRTRSEFYHGLILYASAWVHCQRGNAAGVRAQLAKATPILDRYGPHYLGMDVEALHRESSALRQLAGDNRLADATRPSIVITPSLIKGDEAELLSP